MSFVPLAVSLYRTGSDTNRRQYSFPCHSLFPSTITTLFLFLCSQLCLADTSLSVMDIYHMCFDKCLTAWLLPLFLHYLHKLENGNDRCFAVVVGGVLAFSGTTYHQICGFCNQKLAPPNKET